MSETRIPFASEITNLFLKENQLRLEEQGVSAWSITEIFSALQTEGVLIFIYTMNRKFNFWNYLSVFCFEWCRFLRFTEVELSRLLIAPG